MEAAAWVGGTPVIPTGREEYPVEIAIDRGEEAKASGARCGCM